MERSAGPASSWEPVDLDPILDGSLEPLEPVLLTRSDGIRLLYPGRVHSFFGEPESAKTWLAVAAVVEALGQGQTVLYMDFEAEAVEMVGRLLQLGAERQALAQDLGYIRPETALEEDTVPGLAAKVSELAPALIVVDGLSTALVREGADPNSNHDVVSWWQRMVRPLQRAAPGAALVLTDHVTKSKDGREWAIGASQKRALVDGANFGCRTIHPFGRGRKGLFAISVFKDRPGALRQHANGNQIAMLSLSSEADGRVRWELSPATEVSLDGDWRPTWYMEQVSIKLLGSMPGQGVAAEPMTQAAILAAVGGKQARVRQALELLVEDGYVTVQTGPRNSKLHTLVRPFTATENLEKFENVSTE